MSDITKELKPIEKDIQVSKELASGLVIKTQENYEKASEFLMTLKKIGKTITTKKEDITKPINASLKNIRELFRPLENEVEETKQIIESKIRKYRLDEMKKAEAKEVKIAEKLESGKITERQAEKKMEAIEIPDRAVDTQAGKMIVKKIKKVRFSKPTLNDIQHLFALNLVLVNEVEARRRVLAGEIIPTAELYEEESF